MLAVNTILDSCLLKRCFYFYKTRLAKNNENVLILNLKILFNVYIDIFVYIFVLFIVTWFKSG